MRSNQTPAEQVHADVRLSDERSFTAARRRGQALVEYVLIILFVALAVALALSLIAPTINSIFRSIPPAL
ncbi:MAG TPA: hypothetical protein VFN78_11925 [Ktedonobacterales bacterium]|nr:hypothetical protein [Ktedonobacterales bacterium]